MTKQTKQIVKIKTCQENYKNTTPNRRGDTKNDKMTPISANAIAHFSAGFPICVENCFSIEIVEFVKDAKKKLDDFSTFVQTYTILWNLYHNLWWK